MDHQEINTIRGQFQVGLWPQFLQMVSIDGLRGWGGQSVEFNFPIVAVVGENGSGKITLLKVAACVYGHEDKEKRFYPSTFFVETVWDRIQGVTIDFRVKRGPNVDSYRITKPTQRWRVPENAPKRNVFLLDISRTLPLDASVGYARIARSAASEIESADINDDFRKRLSHVLSRDYKKARFATSNVDAKRQVGLLEREWGELSQFHQGAGEDATLDLFRTLQCLPENSLLIIDEVEASLHPRAQRRLVRFLLWLARQRRIQIVLSTHSPYVLQELPQEARILLLTGPQGLNVVYGVSPEFAMSRLDDEVHPDAHVFVDDREVAVVDGDHDDANCLRLPGTLAPERLVYGDLKTKGWPNLSQRFGIGAGSLLTAIEDAILEPDHHKWNAKVGDQVVKISTTVWEILANEWCKICLTADDRKQIADGIAAVINAG